MFFSNLSRKIDISDHNAGIKDASVALQQERGKLAHYKGYNQDYVIKRNDNGEITKFQKGYVLDRDGQIAKGKGFKNWESRNSSAIMTGALAGGTVLGTGTFLLAGQLPFAPRQEVSPSSDMPYSN